MKKGYGLSMLISIPLAILLHYFIFSKINMHPTLHVIIGIAFFFLILGIAVSIFSRKK